MGYIPIRLDEVRSQDCPVTVEAEHPIQIWSVRKGCWLHELNRLRTQVLEVESENDVVRMSVDDENLVQEDERFILCELVPVDEHETEQDTAVTPLEGVDVEEELQKTLDEYDRLREDPNRREEEKLERLEERIRVYSDELFMNGVDLAVTDR